MEETVKEQHFLVAKTKKVILNHIKFGWVCMEHMYK